MEKKKSRRYIIVLDRTGSVVKEKRMIEDAFQIMTEAFYRNYNKKKLDVDIFIFGEDDINLPQDRYKKIIFNKIGTFSNLVDIYENIKNSDEKVIRKIFLMSDGYFEYCDWKLFLEGMAKFEEIDKISIAIGEGAEILELKKFSSNEVVYEYVDIFDIF